MYDHFTSSHLSLKIELTLVDRTYVRVGGIPWNSDLPRSWGLFWEIASVTLVIPIAILEVSPG